MRTKEQNQIYKTANSELVNGAFRLRNIIEEYHPLLSGDKHVSNLLNEIEELFKLASSGDTQALEKLLKDGSNMLGTLQSILKHDAIEEQTEDNESAAIVPESDRRSIDYFELRHTLMDFENEYFLKIQDNMA